MKKSKRANLENKRGIFFEIGLIVSLALVLTAFQWKSPIKKTKEFTPEKDEILIVEEVERTRHKEPEVVEPPKPKVRLFEFMDIVCNDEETFETEMIWNFDDFQPGEIEFLEEIEIIEESPIFISVERMPKFQGGDLNTFHKYVMSKVKYPRIAIDNDVQGIVTIVFVVDEKGKVTNVEALGKADPVLKKEAIRVVNSSPLWTPGSQMMKKVKVQMRIPIVFQLN